MADLSQLIDPEELERLIRERYTEASGLEAPGEMLPPVETAPAPAPQPQPEQEMPPPIDMAQRLAEVEDGPQAPAPQPDPAPEMPPPMSALERGQEVMGDAPELETGMPGSLRSNRTRAVLSQINEGLLGGENYYEKNRRRNERLQDRKFAADVQTHGQKGRLLPLIQQDAAAENARLSTAQKAQIEADIRNQPIDPELVKELGFPANVRTMGEAKDYADAGGTQMAKARLQEEFKQRQREWMSREKALDRQSREKNARAMAMQRRGKSDVEGGDLERGKRLISMGDESSPEARDTIMRLSATKNGRAELSALRQAGSDTRKQADQQGNKLAEKFEAITPALRGAERFKRFTPAQVDRAIKEYASLGTAASDASKDVIDAFRAVSADYMAARGGKSLTEGEKRLYGGDVATLLDNDGSWLDPTDWAKKVGDLVSKSQLSGANMITAMDNMERSAREMADAAMTGVEPAAMSRLPRSEQKLYARRRMESADLEPPSDNAIVGDYGVRGNAVYVQWVDRETRKPIEEEEIR